ncbi:MAG: hypothetical protein ACR2PG_10645 [Hyphomicrobiaceae bacterium]
MDQNDQDREPKAKGHSEDRREFLKKAAKFGYIAPIIATFSMSGMMARPGSAFANATNSGPQGGITNQ